MAGGRQSDEDIRCALLWRLVREHGWAGPIPEAVLIRSVASHERGRARDVLDELVDETYIVGDSQRGYRMNHDRADEIAYELRDTCGFPEFDIEVYFSHFGGFD